MMQWRVYFAKHLAKRKYMYIVDAEDLMLCDVKSTDIFCGVAVSVATPSFSCCRCRCSSKYESWTWISKDITRTGDKLRGSRWLALPDLDVILTHLNIKYILADLRVLVL